MEKQFLNKWNELIATPTDMDGNEIVAHKIKRDGKFIFIDEEKYLYLDENEMYYLYLDNNSITQEIRKDGYYDNEIL